MSCLNMAYEHRCSCLCPNLPNSPFVPFIAEKKLFLDASLSLMFTQGETNMCIILVIALEGPILIESVTCTDQQRHRIYRMTQF